MSRRSLKVIRQVWDEAPAADAPRVHLLPFAALLENLFFDIYRVLLTRAAGAVEERGPPAGER